MLGQYRIEEEIGRGGMGIVLRAWDQALGRVVALKVLRSEETDPNARARLIHEAQAVAKLHHDNVVTVHAVVNPPDDAPYLVMEYLRGANLAAMIQSKGRLEPDEAVAIVVQVAAGLETAHAAGLIHRDIKPSNILVDTLTGRAKITDFGLARNIESVSGLTQEGALAGTPTYMSPEQARGASDLDRRSDIYSLGVTLYQALTGDVPFHGVPHMVFQQVLAEEPRPPRLLNDRLARDLETICLKAMAKEPGRRYQSARKLRDDLGRWQLGEPIRARPVSRLERGWRWARRRPVVAGLALALVLVGTGGVAGISWKWRDAVHERRRAERERDRAQRNFRQAREAVDTYLTQVSDNAVLKSQNLEPLRRELLRTARDFYERFVQQDPADPNIQAELGRAYGRLGLITSILESKPNALDLYQKMGAIFERLHKVYPADPEYQKELAESYLRQGESLRAGTGLRAEPVGAFQRSRELLEELVRAHPGEPTYQYDLARSLRSLGITYIFSLTGRYAQAEEVLLAAREIYGRLPETFAQQPAVQYEHALVLLNLAKLYGYTDRPGQHRVASEAAIALFRPLVHADAGNPDYVFCLIDSLTELADSYRALAQFDLGRSTLNQALHSAEELARAHPTHGYYRHLVADIAYSVASLNYHELHDPAEARRMLQKSLDIEQELLISFPTVAEYAFYLNNITRDVRDWFGDTATLIAVRDRVMAAIRASEGRLGAGQAHDDELVFYYALSSIINGLLARYDEALADARKAGLFESQYDALAMAQRGKVMAQGDNYDQAELAAATAVQRDPRNATTLYRLAQVSAFMAAAVRNDRSLPVARREELGERFAGRAVEWLQQAHALKHFSQQSTRYLLADDRDLDPLRSRGDFQALVARSQPTPAKGK
jgi:eukaryotic-like serine/threonine-protein kinase